MKTFAAQEPELEAGLLKTVFLYNFAKFTRWPENPQKTIKNTIFLCSVGADDLTNNLPKLAGRALHGKSIVTRNLKNLQDLDYCHTLYLAKSAKNRLPEILKTIKGKPILTISEIEQFSQQGGMIELTQDKDKLRFSINLTTTRSSGLELSARLLDLAIITGSEDEQ
ncbi:MAG: YfiR family protein [Candidatus Thiodiazotropha sp.]